MPARQIRACALTTQAFAPFGDVIDVAGRTGRIINRGTSERFDDLTHIDVLQSGGHPILSVFRAQGQELPLAVQVMERHPLSSQSFYPLECRPFLVIVAEASARPQAQGIHAFVSNGRQGITYHRNTWHHALIALGEATDFLVIERDGPEENCMEQEPDGDVIVVA